jgi:hypothetical protein
MRGAPGAAGVAELAAQGGIAEQPGKGGGEGGRIAGRTSRPVTPSTTASPTPPIAWATTGRPWAEASR